MPVPPRGSSLYDERLRQALSASGVGGSVSVPSGVQAASDPAHPLTGQSQTSSSWSDANNVTHQGRSRSLRDVPIAHNDIHGNSRHKRFSSAGITGHFIAGSTSSSCSSNLAYKGAEDDRPVRTRSPSVMTVPPRYYSHPEAEADVRQPGRSHTNRHAYFFPSTPGPSSPGTTSPLIPGTPPNESNPFASTQSLNYHPARSASPSIAGQPFDSRNGYFSQSSLGHSESEHLSPYSDVVPKPKKVGRDLAVLYDKEYYASTQPLTQSSKHQTNKNELRLQASRKQKTSRIGAFRSQRPVCFWMTIVISSIVLAAAVAVPVAIVLQGVNKTQGVSTTGRNSNDAATPTNSGAAAATSASKLTGVYSAYSASQSDLFFPPVTTGGTGLNGVFAGGQASILPYTQLLAFGSSYSDNAHSRNSRYDSSFAPWTGGYWNRRWTNGPNWTEYLRDFLGNSTRSPVTHWNYAFGGATTNNSIHGTSVPDTGEQINMYLAQRGAGSQSAKPLVVLFTSTNDVVSATNNYVSQGHNLPDCINQVQRAAISLTNQLQWLIPNGTVSNTASTVSSVTGTAVPSPTMAISSNAGSYRAANSYVGEAPDFVVLPIIPYELCPNAQKMAREAGVPLDIVTQLSQTYNTALMQGTQTLATALGTRGQVFTYDVPSWFYSMVKTPSAYSLQNIATPCRDTGCPASDAATYLWWDQIHLVTAIQNRLATTVMQMVLNGVS